VEETGKAKESPAKRYLKGRRQNRVLQGTQEDLRFTGLPWSSRSQRLAKGEKPEKMGSPPSVAWVGGELRKGIRGVLEPEEGGGCPHRESWDSLEEFTSRKQE